MKKLMTFMLAGAVLALTGCAKKEVEADYSYESQAPYADERTVGAVPEEPVAERVFEQRQRK